MRARGKKLKQQRLQEYLSSDEIPARELPIPQEGRGKAEAQEVDLVVDANFFLEIPDDLFNFPSLSPHSNQNAYLDFPIFVTKVLTPKLEELAHFLAPNQDAENVNLIKIPDVNLEPQLIDLNYKMLFELHDIAEEIRGYADHMAALNRAYVHNAFFEACEDFIRKHDDIFFSCRHVQDNIQEKFYQLLKADEVIKIFVEALKETLVDMEKTGKAESSQRVDEDLSLSLSRGFASPLYQYPGSQEKIERSSVSDQDTDVQNRESRDGTFRV